MKKFFKNLKDYFITLLKAIFNIKTDNKMIDEKSKLDNLDFEYIKELINRTKVSESCSYDEVQEQFIKNRKKINEYKTWYNKLVGYTKPPEMLQKIIDADLKLDRSNMNRLYIEMQERDRKYFEELEKRHKHIPEEINDIDSVNVNDNDIETETNRNMERLKILLTKSK